LFPALRIGYGYGEVREPGKVKGKGTISQPTIEQKTSARKRMPSPRLKGLAELLLGWILLALRE
jgi:hypothetical protein